MAAEDRDWCSIHNHIGDEILRKLSDLVDHIRYGAVCKEWYYFVKEYYQHPGGTLPMLLVPVNVCETQRGFYSVSARNVLPGVTLSDIPNWRCCGSSFGWLSFHHREDYSVTLINPFNYRGITVHLPALVKSASGGTVLKLITTPNSTPDNYTVVAIYPEIGLAIIRSGDMDWTYITNTLLDVVRLSDILFHNGLVYAIDRRFRVFSIDINSHPPQVRILKEEPFQLSAATYIVKSTAGDLYALTRDMFPIKSQFRVFKLDFHKVSGELVRVVELETLNGDSIFIGDNYSTAVKASNFDMCVPNSIYFTDDYSLRLIGTNPRFEDSGIYPVTSNKKWPLREGVAKHYVRPRSHRFKPSAVWVQLQSPYQ